VEVEGILIGVHYRIGRGLVIVVILVELLLRDDEVGFVVLL
jgi:hypothetical protein